MPTIISSKRLLYKLNLCIFLEHEPPHVHFIQNKKSVCKILIAPPHNVEYTLLTSKQTAYAQEVVEAFHDELLERWNRIKAHKGVEPIILDSVFK